MQHYLANTPRGTINHLINLYFDREPYLDLPCHMEPSRCDDSDISIVGRILTAFTKAHQDEHDLHGHDRPNQGVWEMVKHEFHSQAYRFLLEQDVTGLADHLSNALRESWAYGLGTGPNTYKAFLKGGVDRTANILLTKDRMISLAIALGVLPQEQPENGRYGENAHVPLEEIVASIEAVIGVQISRPPVMGMFGISIGADKVIDIRAPEDAYAAWRLQNTSRLGHIAELGGGFGGAALQCARSGLRTSVFDLPIIGVLQAYFLIKTLGADRVRLYGEQIDDRDVNILPWWSFYDRFRAFDVVFNRDSMAEFPIHSARDYLSEMKARRVRYVSINQEVEAASGQVDVLQLAVGRLALEAGLRRESRFPYWIRRGYVEEVFS